MPAAAPLTLAGARDRLRAARKKVASTLHYTAKVLCKDSTRRINHGVAQLTQPVEVIFHDEMTKAKNREQFLEVHKDLVFDGYSETLIKVWEFSRAPISRSTLISRTRRTCRRSRSSWTTSWARHCSST